MRHLYFAACDAAGGIFHYTLADGRLTFREKLALDRPMYMVTEGCKAYILLRETDRVTHHGGLVVCDIDSDGRLGDPTPPLSTRGIVPCHLAVDAGEVVVVNYLSGNIVKLPDRMVTHSGHGPHSTRQEAPHTHFVAYSPDRQYLLCCDLGLDTVFVYDRDLQPVSSAIVPAGQGARHLAFHPDGQTVYCVNELGNTVSRFHLTDGRLTYMDTTPALPPFGGTSTAAAIRICGKNLLVSHRGADCLARLQIHPDGSLTLLDTVPCGGRSPRDFLVVEGLCFCTNELTDTVTVLKADSFQLTDTLSMPHPLCVCTVER